MKLYRVVEFLPATGEVVPVGKKIYQSLSHAGVQRRRIAHRRQVFGLVFIQETDTEWVKLK